eukprot:scaffold363947_cov22-Prasinocladus_malaysianus.AAC.1
MTQTELNAMRAYCTHLSHQASTYMRDCESKEHELDELRRNLITLECEDMCIDLNVTSCLRCPTQSLDSMQDYLQRMVPYLSALIIDTVVTAEAKILGTPTIVKKTRLGIALSMNLKRAMQGSYAGYLEMTRFGHLSDRHVDNYLNNVQSIPGVHPEAKRMCWNLFTALGFADEEANRVIA